jgi:DNA-binding PadR family transcriptional regulator
MQNSIGQDALTHWRRIDEAIDEKRRSLGVSRRPLQMLLRIEASGGEALTTEVASTRTDYSHLEELQANGLLYVRQGDLPGSRQFTFVITSEGRETVRKILGGSHNGN